MKTLHGYIVLYVVNVLLFQIAVRGLVIPAMLWLQTGLLFRVAGQGSLLQVTSWHHSSRHIAATGIRESCIG